MSHKQHKDDNARLAHSFERGSALHQDMMARRVALDKMDNEVVLITGITGYVATEVAKAIVDAGFPFVRGTVRDAERAKTTLAKLLAYAEERGAAIELFEADLLDAESVQRAVATPAEPLFGVEKPVTRVLHVASPFPASKPRRAEDVLAPAVDGTRAVLDAVEAAANGDGQARQVVLTSSFYACCSCHTRATLTTNEVDGRYVLSESTYGRAVDRARVSSRSEAYPASKTLAERYAWDFWERTGKRSRRWALSTVLPGAVFGASRANVLSADQLRRSTSMNGLFRTMAAGGVPASPQIKIVVSDVEDVARIHAACLGNEGAVGKRFVVANDTDSYNFLYDVATRINAGAEERLPPDFAFEGKPFKKLKSGRASYLVVRAFVALGKFDKHLLKQWKMDFTLDPKWVAQNKDVLGVQCRPLSDTCAQAMEMWNEIVYKDQRTTTQ